MGLRFVGGSVGDSNEISTKEHIENLLDGNLTQDQVNTIISNRLSAYATKTYVDTKDSQLADSAFIDAQDSSRLDRSQLNQIFMPFTLDGDGKIPARFVKVTDTQKFPSIAVATEGGGGTTSASTPLLSLSVPDPGYSYKLLVFGTVSAVASADNGLYPYVLVTRTGGQVVARGNGIAEAYQTPAPGAVSSRMYAKPFKPTTSKDSGGGLQTLTRNSDWQLLSWMPVNSDVYTSTVNSPYLEATSSMTGVTISANMSFSGGVLAKNFINGEIGSLTAYMQIESSVKGTIADALPITAKYGTLTASVSNYNVSKGETFTVKVRQVIEVPFGSVSASEFATWAPSDTGVSNTLTIVPSLSPNRAGGEITIIPTNLNDQSVINGATTLSVVLHSSGGAPVTANSSPVPRISAIPIPAT